MSLMMYLFYYLYKPYLPTFENLNSDIDSLRFSFIAFPMIYENLFSQLCIYTDLFCFFYVFFYLIWWNVVLCCFQNEFYFLI